ncbi:hypothetical protein [Ottowia testudinis]|uniref:General secretion pathway protein C n=1 Tax=Ottowia testudinis TaxID=2816950 RepID=A0A975CMJ2_9BURK|nr:hypothetical protein [Ottowia testudinis]QTD46228.1 hypothetical protein J1M35_04825 [Ottowia testudinis]
MSPRVSPRLAAGLLTLALWALVAGSALFWWLRIGQVAAPLQAPLAGGPSAAAVDGLQVARALGAAPAAQAAAPAAPDVAGRLALRGIVTHDGRGAALIAVDGKPARPVRVGALLEGVEGDWHVRSVAPHAAVLVAGGRELRLEMPPLARRSSAGDAAQGHPVMVPPPMPGQPGGTPLPLPPPTYVPPMPPGAALPPPAPGMGSGPARN